MLKRWLARKGNTVVIALAAALFAAGCDREPSDRTSQESKQAMVLALSTRFRLAPDSIETDSFRQIIWSDDCLGIVLDRQCSPGSFFGYRLLATIRGASYAYHALVDDPAFVMLAEGPDPRIGLPALTGQWYSETGMCQSLQIAPDGTAAIGLCGGPHAAHALYAEMGRPEEWQYFQNRFAPFELTATDYQVTFQAAGTESSSPAWQRAVASWAALQLAEIVSGPAEGYGLALSARRPVDKQPESCDFLLISDYGRAALTRGLCLGDATEPTRYAWVDDDVWDQIGSWYSSWSPIYDVQNGLEFYAQGTTAVGQQEQDRLLRLADEVIQRLGGGSAVGVGAPAPPRGDR